MPGAQVDGDAVAAAEVNHIGTGNTLAVLELLGLAVQSLSFFAVCLNFLLGFLFTGFRGGFPALALFFLGIGIRKAGRIGRFKGLLLTLAYAAYTCWVAWPLLRPSIWPAAGPFVEEVLMPLLAPLREAAGQIFGSLF